MRDKIRDRLTEYRTEAMEAIGAAEARTRADFAQRGILSSSMFQQAINRDNEAGFAEYMDRSAKFIRDVARGSWAEFADELRDGGTSLKQDIMIEVGNRISQAAIPGINTQHFKAQLDQALDKIFKRKVEDFEFGITKGKDMTATTHNTVNIINSNISNSVLQITQSGKDTISKETAQKLEQLINSDEIKGLPQATRLDVLDQVDDVIRELNAPTTDTGKVHRALNRLGRFISSVASNTMAEFVAQAALAYATANGLIGLG
jgi:hypothetical protein